MLVTRRTSRCSFTWIVFYELLVIQTVTHYRQHKTEKTQWIMIKTTDKHKTSSLL